ncbi:hypothetical protein GCM10011425_21080 [Mucilaginibacter galii]|uniref:Uncharacterized protein n=1 Tax=Mucilaginibacter galii TaxID=2005073 RepID=A0A917J9C9_9SPHI|nr:hypothetical protein GCM10011425_21080 [Mucilaginibacter galii]
MATFLPRTAAGEISEMYNGLNIDDMPTPIPAAKRKTMNIVRLPESAIAMDDMAKIAAAMSNAGFRPYWSANLPATTLPAIHPSANDPVRKPSPSAVNSNCVLRNGKAPDITAKSNPKR